MPFDLDRVRQEIAAAPPFSGVDAALARAVISDVWRAADVAPPAEDMLATLDAPAVGQLAVMAHFLMWTSLPAPTVEALRASPPAYVGGPLRTFLKAIEPLTPEMMLNNAFRQEEALRRWAESVGGAILGETAAQSRKRLEQLDYRKALDEFGKAETIRKEQEEARLRALREAQEREAASSGWRE